ncbi:interferon-induced protein 44-like isoform X2 [Pleurodeles waltl]|uniref:interferon-induced protein 44-like isoform X2 n=1 Tax=Pleurodeles waltl TaxID=8319 RepID=UPI003709B4D9
MSEVRSRLRKDIEKQLCQLLGNARLCLVYKGSDHGFTPQAFHSKCDAQGSTLVVGYNNSGYIFGGFSSEGFRSRQVFVKDDEAFIFGINTEETIPITIKIPVKNSNAAIYDVSQHGPTFGNIALQFLSTGMQVRSDATNDYEFKSKDIHGDDKTLVDIEVYRVEGVGDNMDFPWRKISWRVEDKRRLIEVVRNYKPSMNKISHSRVLMIGPVGAGKSSFFNSVNSIFQGHVATQAVAGSDATSVTTRYRTYTVKDEKCGKSPSLILCDSMGLEEKAGTGLDVEDVPKILDGHVPDRYQIHTAAARLGIPVSCVLPVKNYSFELELDDETDILILHAVQQILRMADLYFDDILVENEENTNKDVQLL